MRWQTSMQFVVCVCWVGEGCEGGEVWVLGEGNLMVLCANYLLIGIYAAHLRVRQANSEAPTERCCHLRLKKTINPEQKNTQKNNDKNTRRVSHAFAPNCRDVTQQLLAFSG